MASRRRRNLEKRKAALKGPKYPSYKWCQAAKKQGFKNRLDAVMAMALLTREAAPQARIYRCKHCDHFHMTTKKRWGS